VRVRDERRAYSLLVVKSTLHAQRELLFTTWLGFIEIKNGEPWSTYLMHHWGRYFRNKVCSYHRHAPKARLADWGYEWFMKLSLGPTFNLTDEIGSILGRMDLKRPPRLSDETPSGTWWWWLDFKINDRIEARPQIQFWSEAPLA